MKFIAGLLLAAILFMGVAQAENFWDTPLFNYGVGIASAAIGVSMIGAADKFNKCGYENIQQAQVWADYAGYDYAYGYTSLANMEAGWSKRQLLCPAMGIFIVSLNT